MNIRKPVDYSAMYAELKNLMVADLPQMELYRGIGKAISDRPEKGAAVIAAEYLQAEYPDVSGFSPRNTRRMREFYRTYENDPALLDEAMKIGWTQNVVILEAELTLEERAWYIRAAHRFGWSKLELAAQISDCAHEVVLLDTPEESCYTEGEATPLEERDVNATRFSNIFIEKRVASCSGILVVPRVPEFSVWSANQAKLSISNELNIFQKPLYEHHFFI